MTGDLRFFWKKFGKIWIGFIALLSPAIDPTSSYKTANGAAIK
jgi:hypothetical protein